MGEARVAVLTTHPKLAQLNVGSNWTAYDAKRFGVKMDKVVPMITQERAYTSPIWYTP